MSEHRRNDCLSYPQLSVIPHNNTLHFMLGNAPTIIIASINTNDEDRKKIIFPVYCVCAGMEVLNRAIECIMNSTDRDEWEPIVVHVTDNILSLWKGQVTSFLICIKLCE